MSTITLSKRDDYIGRSSSENKNCILKKNQYHLGHVRVKGEEILYVYVE